MDRLPVSLKTLFSFFVLTALVFFSLVFSGCKKIDSPLPPREANKIKHVVVIYLENHSFDNLYGEFAGANGLFSATSGQITQDSL